LKRHFAAQHAQLWWDYPPCCPVLNKHTYFTALQIVESAFRTSVFDYADRPSDLPSFQCPSVSQPSLGW